MKRMRNAECGMRENRDCHKRVRSGGRDGTVPRFSRAKRDVEKPALTQGVAEQIRCCSENVRSIFTVNTPEGRKVEAASSRFNHAARMPHLPFHRLRGRWNVMDGCPAFLPVFAVLATVLFLSAPAFAANSNGNLASLNLPTTDLPSSAVQENDAGGRLVWAVAPDLGVVSLNGAGGKAIIEPLNALGGAGELTADFSASPLTGMAPLEVQFTDHTAGGLHTILSWSWDFGDGSPEDTDQHPVHTYEDPGVYTVTLIVTTDLDVVSKTRTAYITVESGMPALSGTALLALAAVLALAGAAAVRITNYELRIKN